MDLNTLFESRNLSDNTLKLYKRNLLKLNNDEVIKNLNFLKNEAVILDKIKSYAKTTQRSYIISICSILKNIDKFKKQYDNYFKHLKTMNSDLKVNTTKTETQKDNWLSTEAIDKIYTELKDEVNLFSTKKKLTKPQFSKLQDLLLMSLYTCIQPRRNRDYFLMKIVQQSDDYSDDDFNYLILNKKEPVNMKLNKYKTDKKYKSIDIELPIELKDVIKLYLKYYPSTEDDKFLLLNNKLKQMKNNNDITLQLNKIFQNKVSSSMLRNIFLSNKYSKVINDLKTDTSAMGTSVSTALDNYIKSD